MKSAEENLIRVKIPYRLRSEANISEHWTKKHKRKQKLRLLLLSYYPRNKIKLPCEVTLTRAAPRKCDSDNLIYAFKYIRDFIADQLIPGLAPGRADDSDLISWRYDQRKSKEYFIEIELSHHCFD